MTSQNLRSFRDAPLKRSFWALGLGVVLMAGLPGCVAHAEGALVADYPADYVETVPPRIEYYPSTYYRGSPAYLVDGRWYYRTHDRWIVFRDEPVELREYRVRRAPAYLGPANRYSYGRNQERYSEDRRAEERRAEQRRIEDRRAETRRAEAHREAERRAEEDRRRARLEAARAAEYRQAEEQRRNAQRAEEHRRMEERRAAEQRADEDHRVAERQGRPMRKRDRSHGDQKDSRDERDRRHFRQD